MIVKILLPFLFFITASVHGQNLKPVDAGSKVHFVIKNFGINTGGDFSGLKGEISFSPDNLSTSNFNVSVSTATIDTDNPMRDKDLVSAAYFDAEKYPEIKIVSTKIEKTNKTASGFYYFTGNLTMHGITKTISFPFQADKQKDGFLFTGEFEINRLDFGVGEKSVVLGSKVIVSLSVLSIRN
jgi:polyisoprenoid-binding protein YceI